MSFGFAISDFIAVGQLAWTLYRECYQIARGAPQEFSILKNELSMLCKFLTILQEAANDPESTLTQAGSDRVRMVNEMVAGIEETLKRLRKVASKYNILGSGSKTKQIWAKFNWSADISSIDRLRNKLIYHNTVMNLLLTSVGTSSLQRIESFNAALASDVQAIKNYIASNQAVVGSKAPTLSAVDDDPMSTTLSANLMINAEAYQPWNTIGLDQWIGAGKWWLLRAQLVLRTIAQREQSVAPAAYADLIKAGWILADVIPCHPQFPFISASKSSELRLLSAEVKNEFSRITALAMVVPALHGLRSPDLRLWESIPVRAPLIRPYKVSQNLDEWRVDGGEHVLFRRFAFHESNAVTTSPCILLFLVHESAKAARLVAQDQYGDIVKTISFSKLSSRKYVKHGENGRSVVVGKEKFVLNDVQEARVLCTLIEAATFYFLERQVDHASLEDLKAYMLLTAVKNQQEQAVMQIRQEIPETDNRVERNQKESLAQLAVSMASQWIEGRLFQDDRDDDKDDDSYLWPWEPQCPLLNWAVVCNHITLTEHLLSEDPVIDVTSSPWHPLEAAAKHGNESVVRWFLNHTRFSNIHATSSLCCAIKRGHTNVVALLIDAGAGLNMQISHTALRSPLPQPVIHAILCMRYATNPQSEFNLREAADRGHEGAIVLLSYAETLKKRDSPVYSSNSTHDSGNFAQVVTTLARVPNTVPAFDLTLSTSGRRRTQVLLKVMELPPSADVSIYLDLYDAYLEDVPEGLSETYKKAIHVGTSGRFSFTVVHREDRLGFTLYRPRVYLGNDGASVDFRIGRHSKRIAWDGLDCDLNYGFVESSHRFALETSN